MKRNWKVSSYWRMLSFIIFSVALLVLVLTLYLFVLSVWGRMEVELYLLFLISPMSGSFIFYLLSPVSEATADRSSSRSEVWSCGGLGGFILVCVPWWPETMEREEHRQCLAFNIIPTLQAAKHAAVCEGSCNLFFSLMITTWLLAHLCPSPELLYFWWFLSVLEEVSRAWHLQSLHCFISDLI